MGRCLDCTAPPAARSGRYGGGQGRGMGAGGDRQRTGGQGLHVAYGQKSVQQHPCNVNCLAVHIYSTSPFGNGPRPRRTARPSCPGGSAPGQSGTQVLPRHSHSRPERPMLWWDFASAALPLPPPPLKAPGPSDKTLTVTITAKPKSQRHHRCHCHSCCRNIVKWHTSFSPGCLPRENK